MADFVYRRKIDGSLPSEAKPRGGGGGLTGWVVYAPFNRPLRRRKMNSIPQVPLPRNEPVLGFAPGSPERTELKAALKVMAGEPIEIPLIIGGREVRTGNTHTAVMPHDHGHVLATYHLAGEAEVRQAADAALKAQREWAAWPWEDRLA